MKANQSISKIRAACWEARRGALKLALALCVFAALALFGAEQVVLPKVAKPEPAQPKIGLPEDSHLNKTSPRQTKGLDLVKMGWTYNCNDCHKLLESKWHYEGRPMVEHEGIHLNHGNNRFCLNCHHPKNRNAFVDYDGAEIKQEDVVQLCGRCHGTVLRDYKAGVHGRKNGFWNAAKGGQTQLRCIQCHDPHDPKYKAIEALRAPDYPARAAGSAHGSARAASGEGKH